MNHLLFRNYQKTFNILRRLISKQATAEVCADKISLPEYRLTTLPSGFRVASEKLNIPTATVGVYIDAGSRFEDEYNNGVAHFLEHMAFKGTRKRTQYHLELEVENIGAHLNAYTSREQTVYYAKCFDHDIEKAVEMLSDILLNSLYDENAIDRERSVILREAEDIEQNQLQEVVFDHLHAGAFVGCSLARTILGTTANIRSMKRNQIISYVQKYYKGPRMVLAAAGGVDHDYLVKLAQKYFGKIERGDEHVLDFEPGKFSELHQLIQKKEMNMCYGAIAVEGPSWVSQDNIPIQVANTMIGQFDRTQSSGLNRASMRFLESLGNDLDKIASFMAYTTSYKDTGLSGLYFITEPDGLASLAKSICEEWRNFCHDIDTDQLERAKRSLMTNLQLMLDGSTAICEDIGRQVLIYGRRMDIDEIEEAINAITPETIHQIGKRYYVNKPFAYVVMGQVDKWPSSSQIRRWLSN